MWDLCYVFNDGHKMRVSITSSNYPRYTINLNNDRLQWEGGDAVVATNSVILGEQSYVTVPTVPLSSLPKVSIV
jgi:predicted acyl esterase